MVFTTMDSLIMLDMGMVCISKTNMDTRPGPGGVALKIKVGFQQLVLQPLTLEYLVLKRMQIQQLKEIKVNNQIITTIMSNISCLFLQSRMPKIKLKMKTDKALTAMLVANLIQQNESRWQIIALFDSEGLHTMIHSSCLPTGATMITIECQVTKLLLEFFHTEKGISLGLTST